VSVDTVNEIGDALFNAVFGFLNSLVSALTGGIITDWLGEPKTLPELFKSVGEAFGTALTGIIEDTSQDLTEFITSAWTEAAKETGWVLDVTEAQTRLISTLKSEIEGSYDGVAQVLAESEAWERETGGALTDFAFRMMAGRTDILREGAEAYFMDLEKDIEGERFGLTDYTIALFGKVKDMLALDLRAVEQISQEESEAAAAMIMTVAEQDAKMVEEWFLETIVKPISYGNVINWAIRDVTLLSEDDLKESLDTLEKVYYERMIEKVKKGEIAPGHKLPAMPR